MPANQPETGITLCVPNRVKMEIFEDLNLPDAIAAKLLVKNTAKEPRRRDGILLTEIGPLKWKAVAPNVFHEFLRLDNSEMILEFARKWGTLGICEQHGGPASHSLFPGGKECLPKKERRGDAEYFVEPLEIWYSKILEANILRRIGCAILNSPKGTGERRDWESLLGEGLEKGKEETKQHPWKNPALARTLLAKHVQTWLDLGAIRPQFSWDREQKGWRVHHAAPGHALWPLFGWLAIRLMYEVAGSSGTICPYCNAVYFPERLPSPGQNHHCKRLECTRAYFTNYKRKQKEMSREKTRTR